MRQVLAALVLAAQAVAPTAQAAECAICADSVVMTADLATCFLETYGDADETLGETVAVDLSRCEKSRSIVLALPQPKAAVEAPDTKFLLSRSQLECLTDKLRSDEIELDPSARIDLGACR